MTVPSCAVCDSEEHLQESFGKGGLNDVCRPCFSLWYDGVAPRKDPKTGEWRVFGEDIREACLKAKAEGTFPFNSREFGGSGMVLR